MSNENNIKALTECVTSLTEKQAIILEILARHLPELSSEDRAKLKESSQANEQRVQILRQSLLNG